MKRQTLMLGIFAMSLITSPAQIAYGPQVSAVYSRITLTGADDGLETTGASYFLLGTDPELDIAEFIQPSGGWHEGGGTMINFVLGAGLDVSKLTISLRYEPSMLGNFHKHELLDDEVLHHIPMLSLGLAFRLN